MKEKEFSRMKFMKYNIPWLQANIKEGKRMKYLFFWGHQPEKTGVITASCFSQWWKADFEEDGIVYHTAEHWMMAQKAKLFNDSDALNKIISSKTPGEAKSWGREVRNFDNAVWEEKRIGIVVDGNIHKFSQSAELKNFLINTQDRVLVEASPVDNIWGIGLASNDERVQNPEQWKGLNLLGFALMEVRDILKLRDDR